MAVTEAVETQTTVLKRNGNAIAEISSITGPSPKLETVDATHLNSDDKFREFIGGVLDGGEVSFEGNYYSGDAEQVGLLTDMNARTVQNWTVDFPTTTGAIWAFTGLVTAYETTAPLNDKLGFSCTIKISGKPSLGVTASANLTALAGIEETLDAALDLIPNFAVAVRIYNCDGIDNASTWVKLTVSAVGAESLTATALGVTHQLAIAVPAQSEAIMIGDVNTVTLVRIVRKDAGCAPITIDIYVARP